MKEVALRIEVEPTHSIQEVTDAMSRAIATLLADGEMEFPVHLATLACNGSGQLVRYTKRTDGDGTDATVLAGHDESPGPKLPIHALLMDSTGYTARVILTKKTTVA
jgi:hypothetical protein